MISASSLRSTIRWMADNLATCRRLSLTCAWSTPQKISRQNQPAPRKTAAPPRLLCRKVARFSAASAPGSEAVRLFLCASLFFECHAERSADLDHEQLFLPERFGEFSAPRFELCTAFRTYHDFARFFTYEPLRFGVEPTASRFLDREPVREVTLRDLVHALFVGLGKTFSVFC